MHDPKSVAFEIRNIFVKKDKWGYQPSLITIWHNDPCKDGSDDSCGWFMREQHGNKEVLKKIRSSFDFEFDRSFESSGTVYYTGYFSPNTGMPNMSTIGIVLDMFSKAAWIFFDHNRKKHSKFMRDNLYDIIHFAENTVDSLRDHIEGKFRIGTGTEWEREGELNHYSSIIYAWILRRNRKWYQHPRWHINHWSIQFHPFQDIKRRYFDRCSVCGKRGFKSSAFSDWSGTKVWHQECDNTIKSTPTETI